VVSCSLFIGLNSIFEFLGNREMFLTRVPKVNGIFVWTIEILASTAASAFPSMLNVSPK